MDVSIERRERGYYMLGISGVTRGKSAYKIIKKEIAVSSGLSRIKASHL